MLWKSAKSRHAHFSLIGRLTFFYSLSLVALVCVIALLFSPALTDLFYHLTASGTHGKITLDCIKQGVAILLVTSVAGVVLGYIVSRKGLKALVLFEKAIARVSADALEERLDVACFPTELKPLGEQFNQMLERLHQSFDALNQFSANLAHELRHPLHHMLQRTEQALSKPHLTQDEEDVYVALMEECQILTKLVDALLFIARKEHHDMPLNRTWVHFSELIPAVIEYFHAWSDEKNITIVYEGEAYLHVDALLMKRALSNLIANALEATPPGGHIRIHSEQTGETTQLLIEDSGIGILPEHLPHLFERFYQVQPGKRGSLGLGLSIVKSILDLHHAHIHIDSTVNQGTSVHITF